MIKMASGSTRQARKNVCSPGKAGNRACSRKKILISVVVLLTLFAFMIRLFPIDRSYFFWDESVYLLYGQYFKEGWSPLVEFYQRPPLLPYILSLSPFSYEICAKIKVALLNALIIPVVFLIGREWSDRTGLVAASIACMFPFHVLYSRYIMTDSTSILFFAFCVFLYYRGLKNKSYLLTMIAGFFLALTILAKFTNLMIGALLVPLFLYYRRANYIKTFLSLAVALATFVPYFILNNRVFGDILYPFFGGFHVVAEKWPVDYSFVFQSLYGFLSPVLVAAILFGAYHIIRRPNAKNLFVMYWAVLAVAYFFFIVQRGVDKPPGIEWMTQRFLFPLLVPAVIISSIAISRLKVRWIAALMLLFILFGAGYYSIMFTQAIELESGLRHVTKDIGAYVNENTGKDDLITCVFNCPSFAYYAQRKTDVAYKGIMNIDSRKLVIISQTEPALGFDIEKKITNDDWSAYVLDIS